MLMKTPSRAVAKNQYDLMLEFAQAVVPHNWNVYWSWAWKEDRKVRHTCNIQLMADPYRDILRDDCRGVVNYLRWHDGITFTQIYLDTEHYDTEETILHELAHVAEQRYIMLKEGGFRHEGASICGTIYSHSSTGHDDKPPDPVVITAYKYGDHGELFERYASVLFMLAQRGKVQHWLSANYGVNVGGRW
jgi:hypothetical protein